MVKTIVNPTATYSVAITGSEPFRPQHGVDQVGECGDAENQRNESHIVTYTRSHSLTKPSIAAKVASASRIIPKASTLVRSYERSQAARNITSEAAANTHPASDHGHTGALM
jgi:hypothetical protein